MYDSDEWCIEQVDIVCGTPGRLEDLISTGKLALHQVRFFVLDECVSTAVGQTYCSSYFYIVTQSTS